MSVANKFVGDGIKFVVGHFNSGVTIPASDVYKENGLLAISPSATNPTVTGKECGTCSASADVTTSRAESPGTSSRRFKGKRRVIHDKTTYGQGLATKPARPNAKGLKEVMFEGVNKDDKDFTAVVSKLKAARPDLVYWGGLHDTGGLILRQMWIRACARR